MIYLDYAASTPVDDEVLDKFYNVTKKYYANPNSFHKLGHEAKDIIDNATKHIAELFNVKENEIIYTSGASESNNMVIKGVLERYKNKGKHIILSSLEHNSMISAASYMQDKGFEVDLAPVNSNGLIDIGILKSMLRDDTILVSVCTVDSELGLKQPIEEIGLMLKEYPNVIFHTDASQAIGKVFCDFSNVDLVTVAPHKFYGMNGISVLIKKEHVGLIPLIHGGRSTTIYRAGTPVLPLIYSVDIALTKILEHTENNTKYVTKLHDKIINKLNEYENVYVNSTDKSIPYTINFSIKGIKSIIVAKMFEDNDIYVSTKTSCCPLETPSKLVYALTKDKSLAMSSIRISLSHMTKEEEIDKFLDIFDKIYNEVINGKV